MSPFGHVALAAIAAALTACATSAPSEYAAVDAAATTAETPVYEIPVPASDFDEIGAALPNFGLCQCGDQTSRQRVSVIRDLTFTPGSSILSRADSMRPAPLHAYLRANPSVTLRITGYGDGSKSADRAADLSSSLAQAVARALPTDMKVASSIDAAAAPLPQHKQYAGRAEIVFMPPKASHGG